MWVFVDLDIVDGGGLAGGGNGVDGDGVSVVVAQAVDVVGVLRPVDHGRRVGARFQAQPGGHLRRGEHGR